MPEPESSKKTIRRTTALVKKAFFDIIGEKVRGSYFLDLYAGEGGVGIEALKRGADFCLFVEASRKNAERIKKRLSELGFSERAGVLSTEVERFLKSGMPGQFFDIIFADPPYESEEYELLVHILPEFRGLKEHTLICIEHFHKRALPENMGGFVLLRSYRYGDTMLSFYRRKE